MPKKIDDIDRKVGEHVRAARRAAGWSQEKLADHIGVTFQQVQKYEKGTNRISVGRIIRVAQVLGVPVTDLLPVIEEGAEPSALVRLLAERDSLLERLSSIRALATA